MTNVIVSNLSELSTGMNYVASTFGLKQKDMSNAESLFWHLTQIHLTLEYRADVMLDV